MRCSAFTSCATRLRGAGPGVGPDASNAYRETQNVDADDSTNGCLPNWSGRDFNGTTVADVVDMLTQRSKLPLHVLAGLAGGVVGAFAMERAQQVLSSISADMGGAPGGGGQQHRKPQSEPATYVAADVVAQAVVGTAVPALYKPAAGSLVHYTFGGIVGALYGAAAWACPKLASVGGVPFGVAVWIVADEIGVPLSGLSKPPTQYPLKDHVSALTGHLVYGAATEAVRRAALRI